MNFIEKIKIKEQKPKVIFGRYFLPFSLNECFLLFTFLLFFSFVLIAFIKSDFSIVGMFSFLIYLFILVKIIYQRFFKEIKTNLLLKDNNTIIEDIASKQKVVYESKETLGLYIFEIPYKKDTEYIIIMCENNKIFINNFYGRKLYNSNSKSINSIKKLILLKAEALSKQRISTF
ncbi:hypothetical protein DRF60_11880 [Chryseobacterium elymi]|uniref:Uncharacterized protein n=1 Tax=Chryseobacterium elymi TaxID=395936 RepID=A0A3D9DGL3_9FLAO|nr:hypothetical protein [Chryseobacterium elymi]REC77113.1 hypothetical protein DRF60_11880 [Chryseobacterium elymi]